MAPFSNIVTELGDIEARLRAEIPAQYHHLADELKALVEKLTGDAEAASTATQPETVHGTAKPGA